MKRSLNLSILVMIIGCNCVTAQLNVGIGVPLPLSRLDVHGAINTDSVYKMNNKTIISMTQSGSLHIGEEAGKKIPSWSTNKNTYVGWRSGMENLNGNANSFFGEQTGEMNQGDYNSIFGAIAGRNSTGSYNSFFGYASGDNNTVSTMNSFYGFRSGSIYQTGSFNTIIGAMSGIREFIGDHNTFIGQDVNPVVNASANLDNSTAIGYQARINASNQMRFGNGNITSIGGYTGWSNLSDGRFKKDIQQNVPGLVFINKLQPVTYHLNLVKLDAFLNKNDSSMNNQQYQEDRRVKEGMLQSGLIAQDVEKAAKEIGYDFSGIDAPQGPGGNYSLRYAEFVVPLIKAVQELSKQNDQLRREIEEIKRSQPAEITLIK